MKDSSLEQSLNLDIDQNLTFLQGPGSELNGGKAEVGDNQKPNRLAQQVPVPQSPVEW